MQACSRVFNGDAVCAGQIVESEIQRIFRLAVDGFAAVRNFPAVRARHRNPVRAFPGIDRSGNLKQGPAAFCRLGRSGYDGRLLLPVKQGKAAERRFCELKDKPV